jgi:hypothetical protein
MDAPDFVAFSAHVIDLAINNGMEIYDLWYTDRAVILANAADRELLIKLDNTYWDALEYMNSILPDNFWFEAEEWGLYLLSQSPDGTIIGY